MAELLKRIRRTLAVSGGTLRIAIALCLFVGASALFWASRDYGVLAPDWDGQVRGVTYNPSHIFTEEEGKQVSPEQIDRDMAELAKLTGRVRTYTVANGLDKVPEIAARYGLTVSLGIWIGPDLALNEKEIAKGIAVARANRGTIDRVFVGNEAILFSLCDGGAAQCLYPACARCAAGAHQDHDGRTLVDMALHARDRQERRCRRSAPAALLGGHRRSWRARVSATFLCQRAAGVSRQADHHRGGGLAVGRTDQGRGRTVARQRGLFRAGLCAARVGEGLRLLCARSVRPAGESFV